MTLLQTIWFIIAFLIISIVLLIDPKSSGAGIETNPVSGFFSTPSSGQQFVYRFSAILIISFYVLTTFLKCSE